MREDGSIVTENIEIAPALQLYRNKLKIISIIMLIVGCVGMAVYIVLGTVLGGENEDAPKWVDVFLVFAVPFTLGLIGYITVKRLYKRETAENRTGECLFFADCFFYNFKSAQYPTGVSDKFVYPDATLRRENEKYGYIYVFSKGLFVAFSKQNLQTAELNSIRRCFRQSTEGETYELKNYNNIEENK